MFNKLISIRATAIKIAVALVSFKLLYLILLSGTLQAVYINIYLFSAFKNVKIQILKRGTDFC